MDLIKAIPKGKEHKITRKELMNKANITSLRQFRDELSMLRKRYIILYDDGYYRPATKYEYIEFVNAQASKVNEITNLIELASNEMEDLK